MAMAEVIGESNSAYPAGLRSFLGKEVPPSMAAFGNLNLLKHKKFAIFCSAKCPGEIILRSQNFIRGLVQPDMAVISGFHSPMERECLKILLRGPQPIIICPARSLTKMRVRQEYKEAFDGGRLLFLSFFRSHRHRSDTQMALRRNRIVAALADRIFVLYAVPSSKTEQLCREILEWNKPLFTIGTNVNKNLLLLGANTLNPKELESWKQG